MLNKVLLCWWVVIDLIFSVLKLDCACFQYTFLLLILEFLDESRLVVVFQLLSEVSLYLLRCRGIIKFVAANIEVSLSKIWSIYGLVSDSLSILATECSVSWGLFCKSCVALTNRKVSSSSWLSEWLAVPLLVVCFWTDNASKIFLSRRLWFKLCTSLWMTSNREVCSPSLPLLRSPLFLGLINPSHLRLSCEGRLFAFQVFLLQQHHF